jgi:hypothetical protein
LYYKLGKWRFEYDKEFVENEKHLPLINFPDKGCICISDFLWPYFTARISSTETPYVQKRIKKNGIDSTSIVEMLASFGHQAISSPYKLDFIV